MKETNIRPMTEQEIENFGVMPDGAIKYQDYKSYLVESESLIKRSIAHETFCNQDEGLYWTVEL